jgi:hypothetical protein
MVKTKVHRNGQNMASVRVKTWPDYFSPWSTPMVKNLQESFSPQKSSFRHNPTLMIKTQPVYYSAQGS